MVGDRARRLSGAEDFDTAAVIILQRDQAWGCGENARCPALPSAGSTVAKITTHDARAPFVM